MPIRKRTPDPENKGKISEKRDGEQMQHVGLVLRARRREMNMSQASLAEKMQTSQEVISNYENGVTPVRADDLPRFAGILAVTPIYFFEPNQQNQVASAQYQTVGAQYQPYAAQSGGEKLSAGAGIDSRAEEKAADHLPRPDRILSPDESIAFNPSSPDRVLAPEHLITSDYLAASDHLSTSDRTSKWTAAGQWGTEAAEDSNKEYQAAKDDARPLKALSRAELENALLAFYRALGRRMQTVAVRLIGELAQDEREAQIPGERETPSPVVVEKANLRPAVVGVSQSKENAQNARVQK
ncbi:MAG: helix-turn-helix domain-containing protein [Janthinobacterium lividum]